MRDLEEKLGYRFRNPELLRTALITFVTYCLAYFTIRLLTDGNLGQFEWRVIGAFAVSLR